MSIMHAFRSLRRAPAFTLIAIGALSLGIGASSALFSVIDGVLLKPLPYPDAKQLVSIFANTASGGGTGVSYLEFRDWNAAKPTSIQGDGVRVRHRVPAARPRGCDELDGRARLRRFLRGHAGSAAARPPAARR